MTAPNQQLNIYWKIGTVLTIGFI